jgi:hypothetical protein
LSIHEKKFSTVDRRAFIVWDIRNGAQRSYRQTETSVYPGTAIPAPSTRHVDCEQHHQESDSLKGNAPYHPMIAVKMPDLAVGDHGRNSRYQRDHSGERGCQNHYGKEAHDFLLFGDCKTNLRAVCDWIIALDQQISGF